MPLKIELKPFERLIINGAAIRNGDRRTSFIIETQARFLRESEIIREDEVDTPCKRLCFMLQVLYLSDDRSAVSAAIQEQAAVILSAAPSVAPYLDAIQAELRADQHHRAIKRGKELVAYEATLMTQAACTAA